MEGSGADSSENDYGEINSGGGFSSYDTKSRSRSESVLNAPNSAYAAVPMQFNPTDAESCDNRAFMTGRKALVLPYKNNYFDNKSADFVDENTGDGCCFIPEGGEDVMEAGVDKEQEKLPSKRVLRRTPKKKKYACSSG